MIQFFCFNDVESVIVNVSKYLFPLLIPAVLSGCLNTPKSTAPKYEPTAEQRAAVMKARNAFIQRIAGVKNRQQAKQAEPTVTLETISPSELNENYEKLISNGKSANFSIENKELFIDGQSYLDMEGTLVLAGFDNESGKFSYIIEVGNEEYVAKTMRVGSNEDPLTFAKITKSGDRMVMKTVTGETITGERVIPTSTGFIMPRSNGLIEVPITDKARPIGLPKGYVAAAMQRGDIGSTNIILLEKLKEADNEGGLFDFSEITGAFGLTEDDDYLFFDLETGKSTVLNVSREGKNEQHMYNCRRQNDYVNKCSGMVKYESLYTKLGTKNTQHYFWSIDWLNTAQGPIGVINTGTTVEVIDLTNDKQFVLFERLMGVNEFNLLPTQDGRLGMSVKLGFSTEEIDDLLAHLKTVAAEKVKSTTKL